MISILSLLVALLPTADGVTVQTNGNKPKGPTLHLEFTEDLRFGDDESQDDALFWTQATTTIAVNRQGHMFVCDPRANRIYRFNERGESLGSLGGKGEGPGEFIALVSFQILADGRGLAFEVAPGILPRLSFFDADMNFIERKQTVVVGLVPTAVNFSPDGAFAAAEYVKMDMAGGLMTTNSGLLAPDFSVLKESSSHAQEFKPMMFQDPLYLKKFIADHLRNTFKARAAYGFDRHGNLYAASSDRYQVTRWKGAMQREQLVFEKTYQPVAYAPSRQEHLIEYSTDQWRKAPGLGQMITDRFIAEAVEMAELPLVQHPVQAILVTARDQIIVVTDNNGQLQKGDVFNDKGVLLGSVELDNQALLTPSGLPKMIFYGDHAYTIEVNNDQNVQAVRYNYSLK